MLLGLCLHSCLNDQLAFVMGQVVCVVLSKVQIGGAIFVCSVLCERLTVRSELVTT